MRQHGIHHGGKSVLTTLQRSALKNASISTVFEDCCRIMSDHMCAPVLILSILNTMTVHGQKYIRVIFEHAIVSLCFARNGNAPAGSKPARCMNDSLQ